MFERYASRLQKNPELRPILQIAASQQLGSGAYTPGRYIRVQFRPDDVARVEGILQSLTPDFLEVVGEHPQELYRLTPAGLVLSSAGPRVSELMEALLLFIRARLSQNPTFSSYTWDDLKRCAAVTGDSEFDLAREVISIMRLSGGGTATLGTQPSFTYGVPFDIEQLRAMVTFDELFELRQQQHEQRQHRPVQAPTPMIARPEVARYPTIHVLQGDLILGSKVTSNIAGSNVGAMAVGDNAHALNIYQDPPTQQHHRTSLREAQKALLDDEDHLDATIYAALELFLRAAREVKVEGRPIAEAQAELMRALDEICAAKGAEPQGLPSGLKVVEALAKNAAMAEVAKKLGA